MLKLAEAKYKLASLKRNQWKGQQPFIIRDFFCSRFQCCWFSGLSLISIPVRFSFVSYTWMSFLVMNAWPVCVSVTQSIGQNFWCYGIKANTKGNTITINMSMCRKPFCSAVNLWQSSELWPAATLPEIDPWDRCDGLKVSHIGFL